MFTDRQALLEGLRSTKLLQGMVESQLNRLADVASMEEHDAGKVLFKEGNHNDLFYLVVQGSVALDMNVPRRGPVRVLTVGSGEILAWSALLGAGMMTTSATTVQATKLVALPAQPLLALCQSDHEIGFAVMQRVAQALSRRLWATRLQLLDMFVETEPVPRLRS